MTKEELYKLAYENHYNKENLLLAEELYNKVADEFPDSDEAKYALQQLVNLENEKYKPKKLNIEKEITLNEKLDSIIITTTNSLDGYKVIKNLDIIAAECAYGMNIFKDFLTSLSDVFGGRSKTTQNTLKTARINCLNELKEEALNIGANAILGVNLAYSEFSGGGKSMLFIVASGTAVIVEKIETTFNDNNVIEKG